MIGGIHLNAIQKRVWSQHCGAVMQDGFIFSDTIANNIAESGESVARSAGKLNYLAVHEKDSVQQEFGVLEGRVASIAEVPTDNSYPVRIELPSDLRTSARKAIPYKPESKGVGNFITQKRNLLQRVFEHLFHTRTGS